MNDTVRKLLLAVLLPVLFLACEDDDPDEVLLNGSCSSAATLAGARVFLDCATVNGNMVSVDVIGADITDEIDGYNIHLSFTPSLFRYRGFVTTANPFMPVCNAPDGLLLCSDNVGDANTSGLVVYSVTLTGADPNGVVIGTGNQEVLGTLMFEAAAAGSSNPAFSSPNTTQMCLDATTSGAALTAMNPTCPLGVEIVGGVGWDDASLTLSATVP